MQKGFIFSLFFAILVATFALKNADKVLIDFIFGKVNVSQAMVILISAILGAVIVAIMGSVKNIKLKRQIKELNKKLESVKREKNDLTIFLEEKTDKTLEKEFKFNEQDDDIIQKDKYKYSQNS